MKRDTDPDALFSLGDRFEQREAAVKALGVPILERASEVVTGNRALDANTAEIGKLIKLLMVRLSEFYGDIAIGLDETAWDYIWREHAEARKIAGLASDVAAAAGQGMPTAGSSPVDEGRV